METTCAVENCENTNLKGNLGYCKNHYERWLRNGDPTVSGRAVWAANRRAQEEAAGEKKCKNCQKVKPLSQYYKRGEWVYTWCKACHKDRNDANRLRYRLDNPIVRKVYGPCAFEGCHNKGKTRLKDGPEGEYCAAHWSQWRHHHELKPLRTQGKAQIDERFRRCTKCLKVKTHDQFYDRTSGKGKQSVCKVCALKVSNFHRLMREERYDEALAVVESMPESLQVKYEAIVQTSRK